ncbi:MAG: cobyric acid synthase [Candidatus Methanomethylophilaceae archaeon]|nr:cobyric acid synthase [Candidatus Methanomethylophilaceae archaeon]MDY0224147.1 cobyric acid synthase [Candidatus Methanomethylophilaceae archaeon]
MKIIFIGTSSGAGKTTISALYCRYLYRKGIKVTPFKASNLSLNSYVTKNGKEIGMGQAFQAWASNIEPTEDMNPVLLKPSGNNTIQLILRGEPFMDISEQNPIDTKMVMEKVCESFDRLSKEYDAVVCEGSGSPVELNLMDRDLANLGMLKERSIPAILIGDIERGGVFAAIYGTWRLIPDKQKHLLKGFIINRFRGDSSILKSGIEKIEKLTGMKCLGVMPYLNLKFPEEDSMSDIGGELKGSDVRSAFMNNLDCLLEAATENGLDLDHINMIAKN